MSHVLLHHAHSEQSSGAEDRKRGRKAVKNQKSASESESESESSESEESEEESGEESESDTDIRKKKVRLVQNGILAYYLVNSVQNISYKICRIYQYITIF